VPLTGEESSIRVLPDLSLYNITLTPILRDEIIAAQKNDEGMGDSRMSPDLLRGMGKSIGGDLDVDGEGSEQRQFEPV
jgi:hypothetical protein